MSDAEYFKVTGKEDFPNKGWISEYKEKTI